MKLRHQWIAAALCLICFGLIVSPQPTLAAVYTVSSAEDLVAAITSANSNPNADTILIAANITLTAASESNVDYGDTGLPGITSDITIEGQGYSIKRDTAVNTPDFRIFRVAAGAHLTLYNVTISGGRATVCTVCLGERWGSGLFSEGIITMYHTVVTANMDERGAGMFVKGGTANIYDSTFSDNSSGAGAGIYVSTTANINIVDSLFTGNSATFTFGNGGLSLCKLMGWQRLIAAPLAVTQLSKVVASCLRAVI